jgi:hypothetical protein
MVGHSPRERSATGGAIAVTAMIAIGVAGAAGARADEWNGDDWALNGTFRAMSNGDWAATNDVYRDEATVRSTWTISMTCSNAVTCAGRVTSDAGWSADIVTTNTEYNVTRDIPNWEPCADGRTVTGHQRYRFFPVDETGFLHPGSDTFAGFDKTVGESGGCSRNDKLEIDMPFRLERVDRRGAAGR